MHSIFNQTSIMLFRISFLILLCTLICCTKELPVTNEPIIDNPIGSLEVTITYCQDRFCSESWQISNHPVRIFNSYQDAVDEFDETNLAWTNSEGIATISFFESKIVYIRTEFGEQVYISPNLILPNSTSNVEIRNIRDCSYNNNDSLDCEFYDRVFTRLQHKYLFFYSDNFNSDCDIIYTEDTLFVETGNISNTIYKVKEYFNNPSDLLIEKYTASNPEDEYNYEYQVNTDKKLILESSDGAIAHSHLFHSPIGASANSDLRNHDFILRQFKTNKFSYDDCTFNNSNSTPRGYLLNEPFYQSTYDSLNVLLVNEPSPTVESQKTYVYSGKYGIVYTSYVADHLGQAMYGFLKLD